MAAAAYLLLKRQLLARSSRVKKFNIGTELRMAFGAALQGFVAEHPEEFDRLRILGATIPGTRAAAKAVMQNLAQGAAAINSP